MRTLAGVIVDVVFEERYWYPHAGGEVWVAGYQPVGADGRFLGRDAPELTGRGILVAGVAGAGRHHDDVLQTDGARPGRPLVLRRDPTNPHDPNAIAVDTEEGGQVGWVPRDLAIDLAPQLDCGSPHRAIVLREQRRSPRDPRTQITMLVAPGDELELRPQQRRPPPATS